ncbi:MAG: phosphate ABC transporter permease PstA [Nitrospirae bacterium]|nr:phosphate ABC transporter permease PstA [Nitrospirota bacterium]MBF0535453.1 phosphate ABC transporter permease PstA [Nitrospirota bacterium]MBF0617641.1 phosphate ABC transporter permease PstA [Nitrospirota bacterium]
MATRDKETQLKPASLSPAGKNLNTYGDIDVAELERSLLKPRTLFNHLLIAFITVLTLAALLPLFSVLWMLIWKGSHNLNFGIFTQLPPSPMEEGGGFGNAILGTFIMVTLALMISVPIGVLGAIYLSQSDMDNGFANAVRFAAKVLTGLPSILAGVFAYGMLVLTMGGYSAIAGGVALSILMLPTIILTSEEAIRMVPLKMKEAAIGMGTTEAQTVWMVLLPTALPGILTGVILALARAAGETAPLLFTALFSNYWPGLNGLTDLKQPTASLAVLIYNFAGVPFENQVNLAWTAALVLVGMVLITNLTGQFFSRRRIMNQ